MSEWTKKRLGLRGVFYTAYAHPSIIRQPANLDAAYDSQAELSVDVAGAEPIAYQWYLNGVAVPGATMRTYAITHCDFDHSGTYTVEVSNSYGSAMSDPAELFVYGPPVITEQPWDGRGIVLVLYTGNPIRIDIKAKGPDLHYQWGRLVGDVWVADPDKNADYWMADYAGLEHSGDLLCKVSNPWGYVISDPVFLMVFLEGNGFGGNHTSYRGYAGGGAFLECPAGLTPPGPGATAPGDTAMHEWTIEFLACVGNTPNMSGDYGAVLYHTSGTSGPVSQIAGCGTGDYPAPEDFWRWSRNTYIAVDATGKLAIGGNAGGATFEVKTDTAVLNRWLLRRVSIANHFISKTGTGYPWTYTFETKIYVDGALRKSTQWTAAVSGSGSAAAGTLSNAFRLGVNTRSHNGVEYTTTGPGHDGFGPEMSCFKGWMDDFRIWDHPRTAEQIDGQKHTELSGNEPGLQVLLRMDGVVGNGSAIAGSIAAGKRIYAFKPSAPYPGPGVPSVNRTFNAVPYANALGEAGVPQ